MKTNDVFRFFCSATGSDSSRSLLILSSDVSVFVFLLLLATGDPVLRASLAMEELGSGQDPRPDDGPGRRHLLRSGEETKEETAARLPGRQPQASQLVGLSLLFLRNARPGQRRR